MVVPGQVAREAGDAGGAQRGERFGHGCAHEGEGLPVGGQPDGVGAAPAQCCGHAGYEGRVVGQPAVHVRDALHGEPALAQRPLHLGQAGIGCGLQR
jgi:hypothetical protein